MDKDTSSLPRTSTDARREREAEALRANLRRRKEQQRARETPPHGEPEVRPENLPRDTG
jgi:hypothetical protein